MEKIIRLGIVHGIELKFIDLKSSGTVDCVFTELQRDDYGLEQIQLSPEDVIIDVGANVGMFSIYAKKKFNCKVIAFEPVPLNFENFKENIKLNGLSLEDFELHNTAITSIEGDIIEIGTPDYNTGGSSIFHKGNIISKCLTEKLNKYITNSCKYLKIDTEGAEYDIVPNIIDKINIFSYIGIEYHRFNSSQNPLELHSLLKEHFKGKIFSEQL